MPAIQAMRSDALAARAKEDVQEKIPSFYNSVNQALGQSVINGQDNAEQLVSSRFQAANGLAAQIRQKIDGTGAVSELTAGAGFKLIASSFNILLALLQKTQTTNTIQLASDIATFMLERQTLQYQWEAAAANYAQWTVQAGYTGHGDFFADGSGPPAPGPVTVSITQWMQSSTTGAPGSVAPIAGNNGFSGLDGMQFDTVPYSGDPNDPLSQNIPNDIVKFTYDDDRNDGSPDLNRTLPIAIDADGDGQYGDDDGDLTTVEDVSSDLYYSASTGRYYILYRFEENGVEGSPMNVDAHRITIQDSGTDYEINTPDDGTYESVIDDGNGGTIDPATTDIRRPRLARTNPVATNGVATVYNVPPPTEPLQNAALGARGALKYRDAYTPRWTDRNYYTASQIDTAANATATTNYDYYFAWGSVGSISRVGHY